MKATCKNCKTLVHSKFRADFVVCNCYNESNRIAHQWLEDHPGDWEGAPQFRGFFLDGGDNYCRYGGNLDDIDWIFE